MPRIDQAVRNNTIADASQVRTLVERLRATQGACHVIGLISPGGVHSHQDHVAALANVVSSAGIDVMVHAILDGRDTPPKSALEYLHAFEAALLPGGTIVTVTGRFFAMDRDHRWERIAAAYRALVMADGHLAGDARQAVQMAYDRGETDEFVEPTILAGYPGMRDGDGLAVANFRADRVREILTSLVDPAFEAFPRSMVASFASCLGMVSYSDTLDRFLGNLFLTAKLDETLGAVVAAAGRRQLRIAETEKYPHVTFFLNGGREAAFEAEERIFVPSPKVLTYDLQPEMSAIAVTDHLVGAIAAERFDLIVANYANPDMVGHTGDLAAAVTAVETVDHCVGRVADALQRVGGSMFLTADHGNCEMMVDPTTGGPHTAHTTNPVPTILFGAPDDVAGLAPGRLADVAPTLLDLMHLPVPRSMTGRSLIRHKNDRAGKNVGRAD